jgi:hypothetical protein
MNAFVFLLFLLVAVGVYWYTKRQVTGKLKKECPNCTAMAKRNAKACPQCGGNLP